MLLKPLNLASTLGDFLAIAEMRPGFSAPGVPGCETSREWLTSRFARRLDRELPPLSSVEGAP